MIDPDLKKELDLLNTNLTEINKKTSKTGIWRSFFNGMFGAFGYIAGIAIVVVILSWFLQKTGLLKPFQDQLSNFSDIIGAAKKLIPSDTANPSAKTSQPTKSGGETTVTLPNGQQIKVQLPQQ